MGVTKFVNWERRLVFWRCKTVRSKMRAESVHQSNLGRQETWLRSGEHSSMLCRSLESAATIEIQGHKQPPLLAGATFVGRSGLDSGTLELKEGCMWSVSSGGVANTIMNVVIVRFAT